MAPLAPISTEQDCPILNNSQTRPEPTPVSGGVEAEKGKKDPSKIKEFINEVMNV